MSLLIFLIFFGALWIAVHRRSLRWRVAAWGVWLALFYSVACGWVPGVLLVHLQAPYLQSPQLVWKPSNVIVLLGAGAVKIPGANQIEPGMFSFGRISAAARLYHACRRNGVQCKVLVSGGDALKTGIPEAKVYAAQLTGLGVAAQDVVLEDKSLNTWKNAQYTAALLTQFPGAQLILVTSGIHLKRSLLYFAHFGVHPLYWRADYLKPYLGILPTAYNLTLTDIAIHEYAGVMRYHFYNWMGWNVQATRAGAV